MSTTEYIGVKVVNATPKFPKFSNGSLLTDSGAWLNLSKDVKPTEFQKGQTYSVEIATNDKGYKSIVKVNEATGAAPKASTSSRNEYFEKKDESQKVGGLAHDAAAITSALVTSHGLTEEQALQTFERVLKAVVEIREAL